MGRCFIFRTCSYHFFVCGKSRNCYLGVLEQNENISTVAVTSQRAIKKNKTLGWNDNVATGDKKENRRRLSDKQCVCVFCLRHLFVLGLVSGRDSNAETTSSSSAAYCLYLHIAVCSFIFVQQDQKAFLNNCLLVPLSPSLPVFPKSRRPLSCCWGFFP